MSTDYITRKPVHLATFLAETRKLGWDMTKIENGSRCITDGYNYLWVSECGDHVSVSRYGGNSTNGMEDDLDLVSEHDDEYYEIMGIDDEDEED